MPTSDYGFTFNGHHSSEFGIKVLNTKSMTLPAKTKVTVQVPYASGLLDLSGAYGNNAFGERSIVFPCEIKVGYNNMNMLYAKIEQIVNWLTSPTGKTKLVDDALPGFYYMAEVQNAPTIQEKSVYSTISVEFTCYPYRFHEVSGNDIWDLFDFETDLAQELSYAVSGVKNLPLINSGTTNVSLTVTCDSKLSVKIGNNDPTTFSPEDSEQDEVELQPGINIIRVVGNGNIAFSWVEEAI
ncbi:phage tail family protein [Liquorilactobacillus satsumensis]|uniref:phage tail family protein n=1 Tax=Liquorilactobacillus satsumensis TaxID=259059 RepID=UPI0021C27DAC|nr:phage tail family protein [Liquorilactobacillus satsumensis]MCP9357369.1 phage tail family protein [Liquorilactobacillus satsumensis]MCP9372071.1 phage tail family protein [Liquorilactobacillus satsumensis]